MLTRTFSTLRWLLPAALLIALAFPLAAQDRLLWRASVYDLDGDGYADASANSNERETVSVGWEWRRGGSEVVVREADATDIRSLGRIRASMLP